MELEVGPFDPELHARSRDHDEAVRREIRLLQLQLGEPPVRLEDLADRAYDEQANLLEAPEDVERYRAAYLDQAREQFQAALA